MVMAYTCFANIRGFCLGHLWSYYRDVAIHTRVTRDLKWFTLSRNTGVDPFPAVRYMKYVQ